MGGVNNLMGKESDQGGFLVTKVNNLNSKTLPLKRSWRNWQGFPALIVNVPVQIVKLSVQIVNLPVCLHQWPDALLPYMEVNNSARKA